MSRLPFSYFTVSSFSPLFILQLPVYYQYPSTTSIMVSVYNLHGRFVHVQVNPDGSSIVRNIGFYPKNLAKPGTGIDESIFGDDSNTPYDVSLTFAVTGQKLNTVINNVIGDQDRMYDLDNFNCTNAPVDALKSINIKLPLSEADKIYFTGADPADLGEDLRDIDLKKLSAENGNRNITRSVSNANNQKPPGRQGG
ncbi:MAG: hypothetical protein ABI091_27345 [Ferruginibacter sp.]